MEALDRLLRPSTIAVIGGGGWCRHVIARCRDIGFAGEIWAVHPHQSEIDGVPVFATVADLPDAPDASFVGVNRLATIDVVRALSARGAGGAVCFASGFLEAQAETGDGAQLQQHLLEAAGEMRILGPNCYGLLNFLDGAALWPDQHGGQRVDRGVGLITQSSNIALNITMQQRGLPLAYVATVGNQAQTGLSDIGMSMLDDYRVTALGLHIEGFGDLRALERLAAHAHSLGKPIVALKVGRSDHAKAATISHTASLAGDSAGAEALLRRLGIGQVQSVADLLETLKLLHVAGPLSSGRIASLSCSGGEAALIADISHGTGLNFPPLDETQQTHLRAALGPKVALANPLDYHTYIWGDEAALTATFTAMMAPSLAMGVVVLDFPRQDRCSAHDWDATLKAIVATARSSAAPIGVVASIAENLPEEVASILIDVGVVPFNGMEEAVAAMNVAAHLGTPPAPELLHLPSAPTQLRTLTEAQSKAILSSAGLRTPQSRSVVGAGEAARAASEIGFPVVVKGEGLAHKTEAGAVALWLENAGAVATACAAMPSERFLVEEMVTGTVAEVLVGIVRDPAHGMVLTIGAGGVLTELLQDSVSLLVPANEADVRAGLQGLRIWPLLQGYRGAPAADIEALVASILDLQAYVQSAPVEEIEINPLLCGPTGAVAVDALIRIGDEND